MSDRARAARGVWQRPAAPTIGSVTERRSTAARALGLASASIVRGALRPPGSKSLAQRALLAAAVARGTTELEGLPDGEDARACLALIEAAGAGVERLGAGRVRVRGLPPGEDGGLAGGRPLEVGESGTLARLATALVALASRPGTRWRIAPRGSLLFRKSLPLFRALEEAGTRILAQGLPGTWPVELESRRPPERLVIRRPASSQEVSGLFLALAAHPGRHVLAVEGEIPSRPYVRMTRGILRAFGVEAHERRQGEAELVLELDGPLGAPREPLSIEPDASSAAVALAAACLSGGELRVSGLSRESAQGDVRIIEHLAALGCDARFADEALEARGFPGRGSELDLSGEPDLAPVLAAVAAGAALRHGATSVLRGLATLPGKESDRLSVLGAGLASLGLAVETGTDSLRIAPPSAAPGTGPVELDPRGDHRMAFAFALLGLVRGGVLVRDPSCVAKSWPSFWEDLERLGARVERG